MPVRTANLMEKVYDLFSALYASQSGAGSLLAFEIGVPITPDMFRLQAPDPAAPPPGPSSAPINRLFSPALAIERLSEIANSVLEVTDDSVRRSTRTVDAMVELLLTQSMPVTADGMAMLGAAKDPAAKAFDLKLGSLAGPFQFRPVYATPDNWYDPDAKDNWTTHTVGQQTTTPTQPPPAPPTRPPLQLPPLGWRVLPNQFRPAIQTSVASGHWMSFTAQAQPAPSIPRTAGTALRMRAAMTAAPAAAAPPATLRLGRPVSFRPLVAAEATAKLNAAGSAQPVATDSLDLGFDHCVVALNWPWFPQAFLLTRNWYVPGYARASFANGTGAGDPGLLPVLPSAFVVIRNLRICAKWSNDDIAAMQASASFGPFSLVGRSFDSGSGALTCPGMQIIGWFYNALPVLPPADDPALAPAAKPSDSATPAVTEPTAVADASGPASSPAPPAGNQPAGSVSIAPAPATPDRAPADPANATAAPSAPNPATAPAPAAALPSAAPAAVPGAGGGAAPSAENPGTTAQGA